MIFIPVFLLKLEKKNERKSNRMKLYFTKSYFSQVILSQKCYETKQNEDARCFI